MGSRKWSLAITVSQREKHHDVIYPSAINRFKHIISCHYKAAFTDIYFPICFTLYVPLFICTIIPSSPSHTLPPPSLPGLILVC